MIHSLLNRLTFVLLFVFALSGITQAQFNETIRTGRPGQSINAYTTGKGVLQFQQGYIYENTKADLDFGSMTIEEFGEQNASTFENVIRYGVSKNIEINAAINYRWYSIDVLRQFAPDYIEKGDYLSVADIGARMHLVDNNGLLPDIAVQARLGMGQSGDEYPFEIQNIQVTGAFFWKIEDNQGVTVNLIPMMAMDQELTTQVNYTIAYGVSLTDKWGFFIENYGTVYFDILSDQFQTYFDGGFSYLLNNNVQLDLLGGYGKNRVGDFTEESFFISAGASWRILTAK